MVLAEVRKSPRFRVTLRVEIAGVDGRPMVRNGDISGTGLFLELANEVGEVGSMQRLALSAEDGSFPTVLLARVARIAQVEDLWKGRMVVGVAFQFVFVDHPAHEAQAAGAELASGSEDLKHLLKHLAHRNVARYGIQLHNWRGVARSPQRDQTAQVQELGPRGMLMETPYPVGPGEQVRLELPATGEVPRPAFMGRVARCEALPDSGAGPARYRVLVRFDVANAKQPPESVAGASIDDAFGELLGAMTSLAPPPGLQGLHLAGQLARVSLPSVIMLCQLERVSGTLLLKSGTSTIRAFLWEGEIIDASVDGRELPARDALREVVAWPDGTFEMICETVERVRRLDVPTSALIMDLVREVDELKRGPAE